jgi:tetratricopeptide (TPR) repeat protein
MSRRNAASRGVNVRVPDGRYDGLERPERHWDVARIMLDGVTPSPARDRDVRDWYHATAALMARTYAFAELITHLERAEQLFAADAGILFNAACLYEALAAPRVQDAVDEITLPAGLRILVDSAAANRRRAERYFVRVIAADPEWMEPRVRLARVRFEHGHRSDALQELRALSIRSADPEVQYFALMFLGEAEETLRFDDAARRAYQRAAELYPTAQAPALALLNLARRVGRTGSRDSLQRVLALPTDAHEREDPWWDYHRGDGRRADALLETVHKRFRRPPA